MNRGFSILELLISLTLLSSTLIAMTYLTFSTPYLVADASASRDAAWFASQRILREMARGPEAYARIGSLPDIQRGGTAADLMHISAPDGSSTLLRSSAGWTTSWGDPRAVTFEGILMDYLHASEYVCNPTIVGDWRHPESEPVVALPPDLPRIAALAASRNHIVVAASTTSSADAATLFVLTSAESSVPEQMLGTYDNATTSKGGFVAVALSSDYAYALTVDSPCTGGTCSSLEILSLTGGPISLIASLPLPPARTVTYHAGRLYIGLKNNPTGEEFLIMDVSNPRLPVRIGRAEIGHTVNDVRTDGRSAYLATTDNTTAGGKAVMVFDVSDPASGMTVSTTSRQTGAGIAQRLLLSGTRLLVGRSSPLHSKEFYVYDTTDLKRGLLAYDTESSIVGMATKGFLVFLLTHTYLEILYMDNAHAPQSTGIIRLAPGFSGTSLACVGNRLYMAKNDSAHGTLITLTGS